MSKYYAIKQGRGITNKIVRSWDECKELTHGYKSIYKSFKTEEEALEYLNITDVTKTLKVNDEAIRYTKSRKSNTVSVTHFLKGVRVDKSVVEAFERKCLDINVSKEVILESLLKEWTE